MLSVENITKSFGKLTVLDGINLKIDKPGIFAVLGPNGSGKTTLLKIILGMVIPNSGSVNYDEKDVTGSYSYRKQIGYLPQIARFPDNLTVQEIIHMIIDIREEPAAPEPLIQEFGLERFMDKKLGDLSGGTRQKVNIVLTFMFDTPIIILDEPSAGLDPVSLLKLKNLLRVSKEAGKVILITSHIINLIEEISDQIIFLLEGKIYFHGTIQELRQKTGSEDLEHSIATILES